MRQGLTFEPQKTVSKSAKQMKYETMESWVNSQSRKVARWNKQQAAHDAAASAASANREFPIEKMKASPRLPGEGLISYRSRINGGTK